MNCLQCHKVIKGGGVLVSVDGDSVCDKICEHEYIKEKEIFFSETIHDDKKMEKWWNE